VVNSGQERVAEGVVEQRRHPAHEPADHEVTREPPDHVPRTYPTDENIERNIGAVVTTWRPDRAASSSASFAPSGLRRVVEKAQPAVDDPREDGRRRGGDGGRTDRHVLGERCHVRRGRRLNAAAAAKRII